MDIEKDGNDDSQTGENGAGEQFQRKTATGTGSTSRTGGPGKEKNMEFWKRFVKLFDSLVFKTIIKTAVVVILGLMAIGAFVYYDPMNMGFPKISIGDQQEEIVIKPVANKLPGDFPMPKRTVVSTTKAPSPTNNDRPKSSPVAAPAKVSEPAPSVVTAPAKVSEPAPVAEPVPVSEPVTSSSYAVSSIKNTMDADLYVCLYGDWDGAKLVKLAPGEILSPGLDLGNGKKLISGVHLNLFTLYNNGVTYDLSDIFKWDSSAGTFRPAKTHLATYYWANGLIPVNSETFYGKSFTILGADGLFYDGLKVTERGSNVAIAVDVKNVGLIPTRLMRY